MVTRHVADDAAFGVAERIPMHSELDRGTLRSIIKAAFNRHAQRAQRRIARDVGCRRDTSTIHVPNAARWAWAVQNGLVTSSFRRSRQHRSKKVRLLSKRTSHPASLRAPKTRWHSSRFEHSCQAAPSF